MIMRYSCGIMFVNSFKKINMKLLPFVNTEFVNMFFMKCMK